MIRTIALSVSLLALSVAGGFGLSQAHSSVMSFGVAAGDVQVTTHSDVAPSRATPQVNVTTPKIDVVAVATASPRLVVQSPKLTSPVVELASTSPDGMVGHDSDSPVSASLRPMARSTAVFVPVYSILDTSEPTPHVVTKRVIRSNQHTDTNRQTERVVQRYASTSNHSAWVPATTQSRVVPNFLSGVYR